MRRSNLNFLCVRLATQGPSWGYLKVNFSETLSTFGDKRPRNGSKNGEMAPRTGTGCPHIGPFVGVLQRRPYRREGRVPRRWRATCLRYGSFKACAYMVTEAHSLLVVSRCWFQSGINTRFSPARRTPSSGEQIAVEGACHAAAAEASRKLSALKLTEVPLLLWDVPLSTFVSVGTIRHRHTPPLESNVR